MSQTTRPSTSCWKICYKLREIRAKFLAPCTAANLKEPLRFFDFDCSRYEVVFEMALL